ncbi:hypothetical protein ACFQ1I_12210 [Kitasatospora arboriphila]
MPSELVIVASGPLPPLDRTRRLAEVLGEKVPSVFAARLASSTAQEPFFLIRCCSVWPVRARWPSGVAAVSLNSVVSESIGTARWVAFACAIARSTSSFGGRSAARSAVAAAIASGDGSVAAEAANAVGVVRLAARAMAAAAVTVLGEEPSRGVCARGFPRSCEGASTLRAQRSTTR